MKIVFAIFLIIILGVLSYEAYNFNAERREREERLSKINDEIQKVEFDNKNLAREIQYLSNRDNLEKELRSKFNYRSVDEKLIIVVPE